MSANVDRIEFWHSQEVVHAGLFCLPEKSPVLPGNMRLVEANWPGYVRRSLFPKHDILRYPDDAIVVVRELNWYDVDPDIALRVSEIRYFSAGGALLLRRSFCAAAVDLMTKQVSVPREWVLVAAGAGAVVKREREAVFVDPHEAMLGALADGFEAQRRKLESLLKVRPLAAEEMVNLSLRRDIMSDMVDSVEHVLATRRKETHDEPTAGTAG